MYRPAVWLPWLGLGSFDTVAQTIQTVEGWFPGSLSYRNNNPGNLRPAGQPGCASVSTTAGLFCSFPDYPTGYQALLNQISLDAARGETISQFLNKYAPAQDSNDPASYAAMVAAATGRSVSDLLSSTNTGPAVALELPAAPYDVTQFIADIASGSGGDNTALYVGLGLAFGAVALVALT
jgi:hypothetical protein